MTAENEPQPDETPKTTPENQEENRESTESEPDTGAAPATEETSSETAAPEERASRYVGFDVVLAALVLVLAFLLASFLIQNREFWTHLATGRDLSGDFSLLGTDPYLFTSTGVLWVNQSWLFDLLIYGLFNLFGGPGLVVFKALILTALALVLVQTRLRGSSLWLPVVCTAVAFVTMAPRLMFDPLCVSLLFFGITCHVLLLPREEVPNKRLSLWLLPVLFLLWVNLDAWFILGPLTVVLVLIGEAIRQIMVLEEDPEQKRDNRQYLQTLALVFVVGLAACVVNPFGIQAFTLPMELAYLLRSVGDFWPEHLVTSGSTLIQIEKIEPSFVQQIMFWQSPLVDEYWRQPLRGVNLVGLAYFLLLLAGMASFLAILLQDSDPRRRGALWPRFVVWLFFAVLSLSMARLVLIFAVVAGPITALNWQEFARYLATKKASRPGGATWAVVGRFLTLVGLLVLVALAWPGWVQGRYGSGYSPFRVGWDIEIDPGLEAAARELGTMKDKGKLQNCFNMTPPLACYCAWFAPQVKNFYDYRFALLHGKGEDLAQIRQSFKKQAESVTEKTKLAVLELIQKRQQLFREYHITHAAFTNVVENPETNTVVRRLLLEPERWPLVGAEANFTLFRGLEEKVTFDVAGKGQGMDFAALAYGKKSATQKTESENVVFPHPPEMLDKFLFGQKGTSPETEKAAVYSMCYEIMGKHQPAMRGNFFLRPLKSLPINPQLKPRAESFLGPAGPLAFPLVFELYLNGLFGRPKDPGPPGLAMLALQAARKGVNETPNNPEAYRQLAIAYEMVWRKQEEYWGPGYFPEKFVTLRQELRRTQQATTYQNLLTLKPDDFEGHWKLAIHFADLQYLDMALEHVIIAKEILQKVQSRTPNPELEFLKKQADQVYQVLEKTVKQRLVVFNGGDLKDPLDKAALAILPPQQLPPAFAQIVDKNKYPEGLGLAQVALSILNSQDLSKMPPERKNIFLSLKLRLYTGMGKMKEVFDLMVEHKLQGKLGNIDYLLLASVGAYQLFDADVKQRQKAVVNALSKTIPRKFLEGEKGPVPHPAAVVHFMGLPAALVPPVYPPQVVTGLAMRQFAQWNLQMRDDMGFNLLAEFHFLRGLIALEAGDADLAEQQLRSAVYLAGPPFTFRDWSVAANYLRQIQEAREPAAK